MSPPDSVLLDRFAAERDEAAFRTLVERHLDHVHSVARRITGSEDLARDVAQSTFLRLAERAAVIPRQLALPAWLHQTSRSYAINLVRAEGRRKRRELIAVNDITMSAVPPEAVWSQLAPLIDELVERLPPAYRDIILFRFYHNQSHAAVAERLGLTEEAARKRAARALDKLRDLLGRRGITTTTVALATLLPVHAATPAPAALATAVLQAAKGVVPVAKGGAFSSLAGLTKLVALSAGGALALLAAGLTYASWGSSADSSAATPPAAAAPRLTRTLRPRAARAALDTPEARFARLREILANADPIERRRDLLGYLDRLPADVFAEIAEHFVDLGGTEHHAEFALTMLAWAHMDMPAALDFADTRATGMIPEVMACWATSDPQAAVDWAKSHPDGQRFNMHLAGALEGIARTDLTRAVELARTGSDATEIRELLCLVLYSRMERDRDAPAKMVALAADDDERQMILGAAANGRSLAAPDESVHLLLDHPEAVDHASPLSIYNAWASQDLAAATASLKSLPASSFLKSALGVVSRETALRDPAAAFALLDSYPEQCDDGIMVTTIQATLLVDPAAAMAAVERIQDEAARDSAYLAGLRKWLEQDAPAARAWMGSHPLPEAVTRKLASS